MNLLNIFIIRPILYCYIYLHWYRTIGVWYFATAKVHVEVDEEKISSRQLSMSCVPKRFIATGNFNGRCSLAINFDCSKF